MPPLSGCEGGLLGYSDDARVEGFFLVGAISLVSPQSRIKITLIASVAQN